VFVPSTMRSAIIAREGGSLAPISGKLIELVSGMCEHCQCSEDYTSTWFIAPACDHAPHRIAYATDTMRCDHDLTSLTFSIGLCCVGIDVAYRLKSKASGYWENPPLYCVGVRISAVGSRRGGL
jgi:hypothetical protein